MLTEGVNSGMTLPMCYQCGLRAANKCKLLFYSFLNVCVLYLLTSCPHCHARGGGSKRTFGSPKSQTSQGQNLADCNDQQGVNCNGESSDKSWTSVFGATMALFGPLLVLLSFIAMIKFCFTSAYPKGYHNQTDQKENINIEMPEKQFESYRLAVDGSNLTT